MGRRLSLSLEKLHVPSSLPVSSLSRTQACHSKLPGGIKEVIHARSWHGFKGQLL